MKPSFSRPLVTGLRLGWQSDAVYHRYSRRCVQDLLIKLRFDIVWAMRLRVPRWEFHTEIEAEEPQATLKDRRVIRTNHVRFSVLGREITVFLRPHSGIQSGWQPALGTALPAADVPYDRLIPRSAACGRKLK